MSYRVKLEIIEKETNKLVYYKQILGNNDYLEDGELEQLEIKNIDEDACFENKEIDIFKLIKILAEKEKNSSVVVGDFIKEAIENNHKKDERFLIGGLAMADWYIGLNVIILAHDIYPYVTLGKFEEYKFLLSGY